ncbi:MAG: hypothetical protein LBU69_04480 [Deltaproteobacteria bacterium]|jgi:hypothetical protein|nr:hypothetical protein [Deltaproteobacteria bacterium]
MRALTLATAAILGMILLNSCVIWKFDHLLTERNRDDVPNISGSYSDNKGQTVTIRGTAFSNTFMIVPPSGEAEVRATMENIAPNRYLVQIFMDGVKPGLPPYFLSVAEIQGGVITAYFFVGLEDKIGEIGKRHNVTYEKVGIKEDPQSDEIPLAYDTLTAYNSVGQLIAFFNELFTLADAQKVVFTKK